MNALAHKPNVLFLIAIRNCGLSSNKKHFKLMFLFNPTKFRRKFLYTLTIHKIDQNGEHWYLPSNNLSKKHYNFRLHNAWQICGKYHREDGPALIHANGLQVWYIMGNVHRDAGPAMIWPNGHRAWYKNNKCHRDDGPAVIHSDGEVEWRKNDKLHRIGGPARVDATGNQWWYKHGAKHRDDGPAVIWVDGEQQWWKNDRHIRSKN